MLRALVTRQREPKSQKALRLFQTPCGSASGRGCERGNYLTRRVEQVPMKTTTEHLSQDVWNSSILFKE